MNAVHETPSPATGRFDVTLVCAVTDRARELVEIYEEARQALGPTGRRVEYLFVLPGFKPRLEEQVARIEAVIDHPVRVLRVARDFGEAASLQIGFEHALGKHVLTVTDHRQVDFRVLPEILSLLEEGEKVVTVRRDPRHDALFSRMQSKAFNGIAQFLVGEDLHDIACGVRGMTRDAAMDLDLYGDQHRFLPLLAIRRGYHVREIPAAQHTADRSLKLDPVTSYVRRLLDLVTIFFLTRFSRKPLRFFGFLGGVLGFVGFLICCVLAVQRTLNLIPTPLNERPLLLLGVLLIVLGVQMVSLGLLGELVIFFSSRREPPMVQEVTDPERLRSREALLATTAPSVPVGAGPVVHSPQGSEIAAAAFSRIEPRGSDGSD